MNTNQINRQQPSVPKRCHGNRSNQRFRRKCRAKGMKPAKIEKLLQHRNQLRLGNYSTNRSTQTTTTAMEVTEASATTLK